ncbi:hypothetical protein SAMN06269250_4340 [Spirosoma fluviale]|uniref:Uncharacterized protein n=1 Tax=Spirosoma fluviale TaxID=1597977 RepID=A0A286GC36_9BACT|nr:hypothetical protein SAMN06269250_4340 [Spirosoma fluviale]
MPELPIQRSFFKLTPLYVWAKLQPGRYKSMAKLELGPDIHTSMPEPVGWYGLWFGTVTAVE